MIVNIGQDKILFEHKVDGRNALVVSNVVYETNKINHMSMHSAYEVSLFTKGHAKYSVNGIEYEVKPGDVIFVSSGEKHFFTWIGEEVSFFNIWFDSNVLFFDSRHNELLKSILLSNKKKSKIDSNTRNYKRIVSAIEDIYEESTEGLDSNIIENQIEYILFLCAREFKLNIENSVQVLEGRQYQLAKSVEYILDRINKQFTLSEIAKIAYVSPEYYCSIFKKTYGITPWQFITNEKLKLVVERLITTDDNVGSIAIDYGFSNGAAFCKLFKKHYGVSPTEYRKVHKNR